MFESLGDRLQSVVSKIKGYGKITEDNISEIVREIRLALLEADVNYTVVKEFTNAVKEKALMLDEKSVALIKELAEKESCVIIGRCADFILKDNKNIIKIFIYSDMENKINRAVNRYHIQQEEAEKEIKKRNKLRSNHYKHYTGREWNDMSNYDICINSDAYGVENAADMICNIVKNANENVSCN